MKARLSTDGGSRGNPGPAAYGYVLETIDGQPLATGSVYIGIATNNVAEYRALIAGLEQAVQHIVTDLEVFSDSQLVVRHMLGEYRVTNDALYELFKKAIFLSEQIDIVTYTHVRREENQVADRLVNEALDREGE